jgi:uncharacterized protein
MGLGIAKGDAGALRKEGRRLSRRAGGKQGPGRSAIFPKPRPCPVVYHRAMPIRALAWDWIGRPGHEDLVLDDGPDGIEAAGDVAASLDGAPFRLRYRLACDKEWRFRSASLSIEAATPLACHIARAPDGAWRVNESPRPDLAQAVAIDIMATPLTNTLPVRTLAFRPGVPLRLAVAYVAIPSLAITAREQEYTLISPGRFRYRGLASGFAAELEVDAEGLVLRYGDVWRRA